MADSLEKQTKKLVEKYLKPKTQPTKDKKTVNSASYSQQAEVPKEEYK